MLATTNLITIQCWLKSPQLSVELTFQIKEIVCDTPQPLKRRGFLGQHTQRRAYAPTELSTPFQDIDCGVVVAIKR